jgi:hypothetical protein
LPVAPGLATAGEQENSDIMDKKVAMKRVLSLFAGALMLAPPINSLRADPPEKIRASTSTMPSLVAPGSPPGTSTGGSNTLASLPNGNAIVCQPGESAAQDTGSDASGIMGGVAFYYLKPYLQNNTAYVTTYSPGTPTSLVAQSSFPWEFEPAAAFWLGWCMPSGLGARARYFYFEQTSSSIGLTNTTTPPPATQTTINPPLANFLPLSTGGTAFGSPGTVLNAGIGTDVLSFGSDLRIHAFDVEATYILEGKCWALLASAGGRYLTLEQNYHASLNNNGAGMPVNEVQLFDSSRNFRGAGPVASLFGQVYFGRTGLSLFGSVRGSFVVGGTDEHVNFVQVVNDPRGLIPPGIPGTLRLSPQALSNSDHSLTVAELELGLQFDVCLGGTSLFVRASAVSQTYFDAGNASQPTGNLGLLGIQVAAGVNY